MLVGTDTMLIPNSGIHPCRNNPIIFNSNDARILYNK